jgi:hypothetical protein
MRLCLNWVIRSHNFYFKNTDVYYIVDSMFVNRPSSLDTL